MTPEQKVVESLEGQAHMIVAEKPEIDEPDQKSIRIKKA